MSAMPQPIESHPSLRELLDAAARACRFHRDSLKARREMKEQCAEVPPHLRADLIDHFTRTYHEHTHQ